MAGVICCAPFICRTSMMLSANKAGRIYHVLHALLRDCRHNKKTGCKYYIQIARHVSEHHYPRDLAGKV